MEKERRFCLAYGSNLNLAQMRMRCPGATVLGTAALKDWELLFRGSGTGYYLTIERREGGRTPVAVWEVTPGDEEALDFYEGYPRFYRKQDFKVVCKGIRTKRRRTVNAFAYVMDARRPAGIPTLRYLETCLAGYAAFGFDRNVLLDAYDRSYGVCLKEIGKRGERAERGKENGHEGRKEQREERGLRIAQNLPEVRQDVHGAPRAFAGGRNDAHLPRLRGARGA